ncbi:MAG: GT4 family glycosyltransferase PelF [Micromonosporaceae bacterium]
MTFTLGAKVTGTTSRADDSATLAVPGHAAPPTEQPARRALRVALVSEGTYPYHLGGVSVWCDQLIRGLDEHRFSVVALTVDGDERTVWEAPDNLERVVSIPLWGKPRARRRSNPPAWFAEVHREFLAALIRPAGVRARWSMASLETFLAALHGLFEYAQLADLRAALLSNESLTRLMDAWHDGGLDTSPAADGDEPTGLTLADALTASDLIEHMLRPLSHPPLDVDICHMAMNGLSMLVGLTSKWTYGTRLVMSEHGVYLRERYLSMIGEPVPHPVKVLLLNFFRALAAVGYHSVDIFAPHSMYNRRWALYNGAASTRMRTMYNGVDPAEFPPAEGEPDVPTLVFMGRIDPLKDLHTLLRAFAVVRQEVPDARLRIFGPVPAANQVYYDSCEALLRELGLVGAAVFEGRVGSPIEAYHAGHLVVLSSISEGFPYTVVESMASGRPPVCTNVGGVSEAVGDTGFVVPPRDHETLAGACVRLLRDDELRHRLGVAARERVLDNFTLAQSLDAYRAVYRDLP